MSLSYTVDSNTHLAQLRLHLVGRQLFAQGGSPEQHITVVGQQFGALGLGRCLGNGVATRGC